MAGNPIKRAREGHKPKRVAAGPLTRAQAILIASRTARRLEGTRDCILAIELALDLQGLGVKAVPLAPVAPTLPAAVIDGASGVVDRLAGGGA